MSPAPPAQYPKRPGSRNGSAPVAHGFDTVMTRAIIGITLRTLELRDLPAPAYAHDGASRGRSTCRRGDLHAHLDAHPPHPSSPHPSWHKPDLHAHLDAHPPHPSSPPPPLMAQAGAPRSTYRNYRTSTCTSFQSPDAISPCDRHQFQSAVSVGSFSRHSFSRARPGRSSQPLESKSWAPLPLRSLRCATKLS
jgi:hypothetical protein